MTDPASMSCEPASDEGIDKNGAASRAQMDFLASFLVVAVAFLVFGYTFPSSDHFQDLPSILAVQDGSLYRLDFHVQEMLRFTPRFYYQRLVAAGLGLGIPLEILFLFLFLTAFSATVLALHRLGGWASGNLAGGPLMILLALLTRNASLGDSHLMQATPVASTFAMGFAAWGIVKAIRFRWVSAYGLLGCATCLQFLVGMLPALLLFPALVLDAREETSRRTVLKSIGVFTCLSSLVLLPMLLGGTTSTGVITNAQFVQIYAEVRHPHHLIPSSWGLPALFGFLAVVASSLMALREVTWGARERRLVHCVYAVAGITLLLNYLLVEAYPVALVAKLQFARTTPFVLLLALAVLVGWSTNSARWRWAVPLVVGSLASPLGPLLLLTVLIVVSEGKPRLTVWVVPVAIVAGAIGAGLYPEVLGISRGAWYILVAFGGLFLIGYWTSKLMNTWWERFLYAAGCIGALLLLGAGIRQRLPERLQVGFSRQIQVLALPGGDLERIALDATDAIPAGALVIVPPSAESFRFYSRKSVFVDVKSIPYTDAGLLEWESRLKVLLGRPLERGILSRDLTSIYTSRDAATIISLARHYHATHIVGPVHWDNPALIPLVRRGPWILFALAEAVPIRNNVPEM